MGFRFFDSCFFDLPTFGKLPRISSSIELHRSLVQIVRSIRQKILNLGPFYLLKATFQADFYQEVGLDNNFKSGKEAELRIKKGFNNKSKWILKII